MKLLFAPQHWGLGHITRSIPIIQYFIDQKFEVELACSGAGKDFLSKEFPNLVVHELPDYNINYPSNSMVWNMFLQIIKLHKSILHEHFVCKKLCKKIKPDLIISDARLGVAQKGIPSIIISHHLHFPLGNRFLEWISDTWVYFFYKTFDQLWVPDTGQQVNLAGNLSHNFKKMEKHFLGIVSRFKKLKIDKQFDIAFILSGPEPQRSFLEQLILNQKDSFANLKCVLVRGNQNAKPIEKIPNLDVIPLALSGQINEIMCASDLIVCRSGYTTLLDLAVIQKPAILIPTPGQPEQEYLANELFAKKLFYCQEQYSLDLVQALIRCKEFNGYPDIESTEKLDVVIPHYLEKLFSKKYTPTKNLGKKTS